MILTTPCFSYNILKEVFLNPMDIEKMKAMLDDDCSATFEDDFRIQYPSKNMLFEVKEVSPDNYHFFVSVWEHKQ